MFLKDWIESLPNSHTIMTVLALIVGLAFLVGHFSGYFESEGNNLKTQGFITLGEHEITLDHVQRFPTSELSKLRFKLDGYKGEFVTHREGKPKRKSGADNYISFSFQGKKHGYQFVVDSPTHREMLDGMIERIKLVSPQAFS